MKISDYPRVIALFLLAIASSCNKIQEDPVFSEYIESVSASPCADNVLRMNIDISFRKECSYSISYWEKSHPEIVTTTKTVRSGNAQERATLLFLYPESEYLYTVNIGEGDKSRQRSFKTGELPQDFPIFTENTFLDTRIPGYVFLTDISGPGYMTITDSDGVPVWYQYSKEAARVFDVQIEDGRIWLLTGFLHGTDDEFQRLASTIRCIDLQGNTLSKWSIRDGEIAVPYAHHEIRQMPDGNLAVVTNFTGQYDLSPIGGNPDTTIYGDGFTIFTPKGEVIREWNALDQIDLLSSDYLFPLRFPNDILHANSFNWDSEGNYYMTFNNCSQIWKIDAITGKVLYRVGPGGNVVMDKGGEANGLHAAVPLEPDRILCLDNGRSTQHSRAIIYKVNPTAMSAQIELSVPLETSYSSRDRSNVELIEDSTMLMFGMTGPQTVVFTDLEGNVIRTLKKNSMSYRAHYIEKLPL